MANELPNADILGNDVEVAPPPPPPPYKVTVSVPRTPQIPKRMTSTNAAEILATFSSDPEKARFTMELKRRGPSVWEGQEIVLGVLESINQVLPYPDLLNHVKAKFGGGEYTVTIIDEAGRGASIAQFAIPVMEAPPINASPRGAPSIHMTQAPGVRQPSYQAQPFRPFGALASPTQLAEDDETIKLRNEERQISAQISKKAKEQELWRKENEIAKERETAQERELRTKGAPAQELTTQLAKMQSESDKRFEAIVAQQSQSMQAVMQMMMQAQQQSTQMMVGMMTAMGSKKEDNSTVMLMMESMKQQSTMMATFMQTIVAASSSKSGELTAAMQTQLEANKQVVDMAIKASSGGNSRYDKLIEQLMLGKMDQGNNSVKQAIDLMNMGRQQAMEMLEMQGGKDDEDLSYDPKAGVGGNVMKAIFGLLKGIMKGGGGGLAEVVAGLAQRANPAAVTDTDLVSLASRFEREGLPAQLQIAGPPPGAPAFGAPTQRVVQQPQQYVQQPQQYVQQPQQMVQAPPQPQRAPQVVVQPPVLSPQPTVHVATLQKTHHPVSVDAIFDDENIVVPTSVSTTTLEEGASDDFVTEAMEVAIQDLRAGRRSHSWTEIAFDRWERPLLDAVAAADGGGRISLIRERCDVTVFEELMQLATDSARPDNYRNFMAALQQLAVEHASNAGVAVKPG